MNWMDVILTVAYAAVVAGAGAWNVAALRRRRIRERQETDLRHQVWLDDPGTASPGEERGE